MSIVKIYKERRSFINKVLRNRTAIKCRAESYLEQKGSSKRWKENVHHFFRVFHWQRNLVYVIL